MSYPHNAFIGGWRGNTGVGRIRNRCPFAGKGTCRSHGPMDFSHLTRCLQTCRAYGAEYRGIHQPGRAACIFLGEEKPAMTANDTRICPLCGGNREESTTTFTADLETGVVVIRRVPAEVCTQCGEEWIGDATARALEKITEEARRKHCQFEVVAYA